MYIVYLVLAGVQAWYATKKGWMADTKGKGRYLALCCAELILLVALRGRGVGSDTATYLDALAYYSSLPKSEVLFAGLIKPFDFEVAYFGLTKICALINMPPQVFLALIAAVIYVPVFMCIHRYSKLPYISILAYFAIGQFAYSLGFFRQLMAFSIVLCGLTYLEKRKLWKFLPFVLIAATFHRSALFMVVLYVAYAIPFQKYVKWLIPAELACLLLGRPISLAIVAVLPRYAAYIGGRYDVQGGTYLMLLLLTVLLLVLMYLHRRGFTDSRLLITALTLAVFVQAVGYSMAVLGRAVLYFSFFAIFAFSEIVFVMMTRTDLYATVRNDLVSAGGWCVKFAKKHNLTLQKVVLVLAVVGLFGLFLFSLLGNKYIFPYTFWFMN